MSNHGLAGPFLDACERWPDRPALDVAGQMLTYSGLKSRAARIATILRDHLDPEEPLVAVFGERSVEAFSGLLGALLAGRGYVPLNPVFPISRTQAMLARAGCRAIVLDEHGLGQLEPLLSETAEPRLLICPGVDDVSDLRARFARHTVVGAGDLPPAAETAAEPEVAPDDIAYLLFTSGSTGVPKGVMVSHGNVRAFLAAMRERFDVDEQDRCSQTFDLTFDLSVFDMFVAWQAGAALCCPTRRTLLNPSNYVRRQELTVWFSVPSLAILMERMGGVKPQSFPSLRWSLFCGEALPVSIADAWAAAAPRSQVENLYGPTELTIACTAYRWDGESSRREARYGVVPIGQPFGSMVAVVVDDALREVAPGEAGELLVTGEQLTLGYWRDPERTAAAFVALEDRHGTYYRTGDRVLRPGEGEPLCYVGRVDNQIKVNGYRVELGEIEAVLREATRVNGVVALGWPRTEAGAGGVVAFLESENNHDAAPIRQYVAARLPTYMVPREIRSMAALPLNANGKYDRVALTKMLEDDR